MNSAHFSFQIFAMKLNAINFCTMMHNFYFQKIYFKPEQGRSQSLRHKRTRKFFISVSTSEPIMTTKIILTANTEKKFSPKTVRDLKIKTAQNTRLDIHYSAPLFLHFNRVSIASEFPFVVISFPIIPQSQADSDFFCSFVLTCSRFGHSIEVFRSLSYNYHFASKEWPSKSANSARKTLLIKHYCYIRQTI